MVRLVPVIAAVFAFVAGVIVSTSFHVTSAQPRGLVREEHELPVVAAERPAKARGEAAAADKANANANNNANAAPAIMKDGCLWTYHPGTSLGEMLTHDWKHCADEGAVCKCQGTIRFGAGQAWHKFKAPAGEAECNRNGAGGVDPAEGVKKVCECEESASEMGTLEQAKAKCLSMGRLCKGVSCRKDDPNGCSARDGVPYLEGNAGENSYVKDCNDLYSRPGGGVSGKHRIDGEPTIFISIAAYRDRDCNNTVDHLFKQARFPRRVFVGIVCQQKDGDVPCLSGYSECQTGAGFCVVDQVRQRVFPSSEAKGPTHARAIAASLYRNEDYFFMMDAHNRFVSDWDMKILDEHAKCEQTSEKCILSVYPMGVDISDKARPRPLGTPAGSSLDTYTAVAHLCNGEYHNDAIIKNARAQTNSVSYWPRPTLYTGAGLLFGPGKMLIECPFDPHVPYVWDGEEFLYTARLWTWGYDMYSPGQNILFHHYYRSDEPRIWSEPSFAAARGGQHQAHSYERLQYILGVPKKGSDEPMVPPDTQVPYITRELPKYGLGPYRTMDEFWALARADIRNRDGDPAKGYEGYFCKKYRGTRSRADGPYELPEAFTKVRAPL